MSVDENADATSEARPSIAEEIKAFNESFAYAVAEFLAFVRDN